MSFIAITKEARNMFKQMEENGFQEKNQNRRVCHILKINDKECNLRLFLYYLEPVYVGKQRNF